MTQIKDSSEILARLQAKNVADGPEEEVFYETPNERAYVQIDGIPISQYFDVQK